jgi:methionyl-tRNA formyltransferase
MPVLAPLVFFGTPEFAVPTLEALVEAGRAPALVVSQPSRPVGRTGSPQAPPAARWALQHGLPLLQPERVRSPEFLAALRPLRPAIAVVVAFGQIFPRQLLDLPTHGCLNLHASLLPRHRGAAPIQAAIAAGDARTGVTVMRMEEGLDSGPILLQAETAIAPHETAGELSARLATLGARLMLEALDRLELAELVERPQDGARATLAPRLERGTARADWNRTAADLANRWRAWSPWPGLTAELRGAPVKLLQVSSVAADPAAAKAADTAAAAGAPEPGAFLGLTAAGAVVACGGGTALAISRLQRPGRKPQPARDFVNGERLRPGERFS